MTFPNLTALAQAHPVVLGSGSPRRLQLLSETGISFTQIVPHIPEDRLPGEFPYPYAERLAREKAQASFNLTGGSGVAIGCDTIVVLGSDVFEKPTDEADAFRILTVLSGRQHVVCTAAAYAFNHNAVISGFELTEVYFNSLDPDRIWEYIKSGEPMDKAGGYGIQGMGGFLVDRIVGNLDTVVGLPRTLLERLAGEVLHCLQDR
ncbi:MAG: Maf family protein [Candidatus Zixiibacteriota bacterium]